MGKFLDFLTGGNPKVICQSIANVYNEHNRDYDATFSIIGVNILVNYHKSNNPENINLHFSHLGNLSQLANLHLNSFASPKNTGFGETWSYCGEKLMDYLEEFGLNIHHICDQNPFPKDLRLMMDDVLKKRNPNF